MDQFALFEHKNPRPHKPKTSGNGQKFQNQVASLLRDSGWTVDFEYVLGFKLGKRTKHRVDIKASKGESDILVSCKYQEVSGTAPEKLPYEYMCLLHAVKTNLLTKAFMVLQGAPLLKDNVFAPLRIGEMERYMTISSLVQVCDFQDFSRIINRHEI